jgi:uncharacterized protein YecE (DUF72 family)
MRKGLHIGTCGWSYPEWMDLFYSSRHDFLQQYMTFFDLVEINTTFYGPLSENVINKLLELPEEKFFTSKIPHMITHSHRLDLRTEARDILDDFFIKMKPLLPKLEVLLIQLPPWDITNMGNLETFLSVLDMDYRYAIEFRHKSWLNQRVFSLVEDYGIAYTIVDEPKLPIDLRITADFSYIRWHGHGEDPWYNYRYSLEELRAWKLRLLSLSGKTRTIFGLFNNHFNGNGPMNALQMMELMDIINPVQRAKMDRMLINAAAKQTSIEDF